MRTERSIKNILTTIIPFLIIGALGFVKVRVFVGFLKDDLYSLSQLFYQIFSYLSLAEAGFGMFITQKYYKQLAKNNEPEIKAIYATSAMFFRLVGLFIIMAALVFSFFIHFLTKADIDKLYIQLIFIIFVVKNSVDYFMTAPRFLIAADQKMFKINLLISITRIAEIIVEIILVYKGVNYLIVLVPGIFIRILFNLLINRKVYAEYPFIKGVSAGLNKKYLKGVGNVVAQRLVGVANSNTDIILASTFINPVAVVIYTSYTYITKFIFDVTFIIANAINSSFASAVNEDKANSRKMFEDLNSAFILEASFVFVFLYCFLNNVISLWVGDKYLLDDATLVILLAGLFLDIAQRVSYMTINSEGLFRESKWAIGWQALFNLVLSLLLVRPMGLMGVLAGTLLSNLVTTFWYLPNLAYKRLFGGGQARFFVRVVVSGLLSLLGAVLFSYIIPESKTVGELLINFVWAGLLILLYVAVVNYANLNLSSLVERVVYFVRSKPKALNPEKITFYVLHMSHGGVESSVANMANMLADDFEVEVVSFYDFGPSAYKLNSKVKLIFLTNQKPNRQAFWTYLKSGNPRFLIEGARAVRMLILRRKLVAKHVKSNDAKVLFSTRLLFHDLVSRHGRSNQVKICQEHVDHKDDSHYVCKVLAATKNADYLLPVSQFLTDSYQSKITTTWPKVKFIRHAVDVPRNINYRPSKKLVSVGRLSPEKGFADLLTIFKTIHDQDPEYTLGIIGDGVERSKLERQINELNLIEVVTLYGFVDKTKVAKTISQAGLFVLPSHEESFGLVIIESFAQGVPVAAFDSARGAVEIIKNSGAGILIEDRNCEKMARQVIELDTERLEKMSIKARAVASKYDFAIIKSELINFITIAIKEKQ